MGDEQDGGAELGVQLLQEMKNLALDGDVEGGRRFVGDDQRRLVAEADGQHDALAHAAGELMGIALERALRRGHAHAPEQADGALMGGPPTELAMGPHALDDLLGDALDGIERGHRVLEDHADRAAAQPPELATTQMGNVATAEDDATRRRPGPARRAAP